MNRWRPARALLHPLFWAALAVLVVNDHLLKGAGVLPGGLTGKLSDVAGLLVAPWVLALLCRASTTRGVLLAHALVGVGFAGINVWPALARSVERLTTYTPFPWRITVDPTDLLTLPALAASFFWLGAVARRESAERPRLDLHGAWARAGSGLSFACALLACMATSSPPPPDGLWGSLFVVSAAADERIITMRALRDEVVLDCDFVAEDPTRRLPQALFGPVLSWQLAEGEAAAISPTRGDCDAVLLGGGGAAPALVFWRDDELPDAEQIPWETLRSPGEHSILLEDDAAGTRFSEHPLLFAAPPLSSPKPADDCEVRARGAITWSEQVPRGSFVLTDVVRAPDGCSALDLVEEGEESGSTRMFLCLDGSAVPFSIGELLTLEESASAAGRSLVIASESLVLEAVRGALLAGQVLFDPLVGAEGCGGTVSDCGSVVLPASVVVQQGSSRLPLEIGVTTTLSSGQRLHLAVALVAPVRDASCDATAAYLESFSLRETE